MKRKIKLNFMKKNQVVVAVTGLMLIAAGYLNYTNNEQTNSYIEVGSLADSMDMAEMQNLQVLMQVKKIKKRTKQVVM